MDDKILEATEEVEEIVEDTPAEDTAPAEAAPADSAEESAEEAAPAEEPKTEAQLAREAEEAEKARKAKWHNFWDKVTTGIFIFLMASPFLILAYIFWWFVSAI